jgi:hypothetical protein
MKKTIAVIGSAAALTFAGAGLAAAQEADETTGQNPLGSAQTEATDDTDATDEVDTPAEVSDIAEQLCGTISAYDFLGSAGGVVPGLSGEECEANADAAVAAALTGDIAGALDILRGIDAGTPDEDETADSGSAELLGSLTGDAGDDESTDETDETEAPAFGS